MTNVVVLNLIVLKCPAVYHINVLYTTRYHWVPDPPNHEFNVKYLVPLSWVYVEYQILPIMRLVWSTYSPYHEFMWSIPIMCLIWSTYSTIIMSLCGVLDPPYHVFNVEYIHVVPLSRV